MTTVLRSTPVPVGAVTSPAHVGRRARRDEVARVAAAIALWLGLLLVVYWGWWTVAYGTSAAGPTD